MGNNIRQVNTNNWPELERDPKATLVDFWAEWCAPCRMMESTFEKLADKYAGSFNFAKVNVDESPELAGKFGIRSIPTLLLIKDGAVAEQLIGTRSFDQLAQVLEKYIPASTAR